MEPFEFSGELRILLPSGVLLSEEAVAKAVLAELRRQLSRDLPDSTILNTLLCWQGYTIMRTFNG